MLVFKKWRRRRLGQKAFPEPWLKIIDENVPFYKNLPDKDKKELLRHILIFMSEKHFEGCGGLNITNEPELCLSREIHHLCRRILNAIHLQRRLLRQSRIRNQSGNQMRQEV